MKNPSDCEGRQQDLWKKLIGLGEQSGRKSYYPELQKRLEELERFRQLLDNSHDLIFLLDATSERVVDVNQPACDQTGFSRGEWVDQPFFDRLTEPSTEKIRRCLRGGSVCEDGSSVDCVFRTAAGDLLQTEAVLSRMTFDGDEYIGVIAGDVTRSRKIERQLRESERRLLTLMDNLPGMAYRCRNDEWWTMEFVSQGCFELTGYAAEDLMENRHISYDEVIHPDDRDEVHSQVTAALDHGLPFQLEYRIRTKSHGVKWVWEQGQSVPVEPGQQGVLEGFIVDVTETRLAKMTLEESNRMKTEFIKTAAHEFRTPLTSIRGFSELLLLPEPLPEEDQHRALEYIYERTQALSALVDGMLDISRMEAGAHLELSCQPCSVAEVVRQVEPFIGTQIGERQVDVSLQRHDSLLFVDKGKIGQVLENLLSNAVKFSAEDSVIQVRGDVSGDRYRFAIVDQGIGMTDDQVERMFDKFYRADASDSAVGGIGLGMSIVKSIVEAHDGKIWVESQPKKGTRVLFTVPLSR